MAPRKVRLVIDVVRGLATTEAEAQLMMMKKRAAPAILKLLRSAMANANELKMVMGKLRVAAIRVDQGPTMKRSLPRAKGSASPIHKMTSHISIILAESEKDMKPARFVMIPREKKESKEKKARVPGAPKGKAKPAEKPDKKSSEDPGFMRRVFRRKSG